MAPFLNLESHETKEELLNKLEPMVDMYIALDGSGVGLRKYFRSQDWYRDTNIYSIMLNILFHMVRLRLGMDRIVSDEVREKIINSLIEQALLSKKPDEALISMGISNE